MERGFRDMLLWQKAHGLVLDIYQMSISIPDAEKFGIKSQIQRSCVSVPSNIVEGYGRISLKEKLSFLYIANGSLEETRYFLILIQDLNFTNTDSLESKLIEVSKMLNSYIKKIKARLKGN